MEEDAALDTQRRMDERTKEAKKLVTFCWLAEQRGCDVNHFFHRDAAEIPTYILDSKRKNPASRRDFFHDWLLLASCFPVLEFGATGLATPQSACKTTFLIFGFRQQGRDR